MSVFLNDTIVGADVPPSIAGADDFVGAATVNAAAGTAWAAK